MVTGSQFMPSLVSLTPGTVRVAFQTNWDRDDKTLHYQVIRNGNTANPVWTSTADSEFWNRPTIGFTDTGLTPGATYQYRVFVSDGDGNLVKGDTATITVPTTTSQTAYDRQVIADGASSYWPLDEPSGTVFYDNAGFNDMDATAGVTRGVAGPASGENGSTFDGASDGTSATRTAVPGPDVFTLSAWVKTTTTSGRQDRRLRGRADRHLVELRPAPVPRQQRPCVVRRVQRHHLDAGVRQPDQRR